MAENIAVKDGDVVGVNAQQLQSGVAVTGDVGRPMLPGAAHRGSTFRQVGLILDNQHTHSLYATAGIYRRHTENYIHTDNTTLA